ncbi:MAG: DUF1540 domain-containing protein [Oscillospiraceae bacterium]|jgi:hypothetical protein|nr:DUF1540 domain-containing protein [Oscillospiraceae bacterium]
MSIFSDFTDGKNTDNSIQVKCEVKNCRYNDSDKCYAHQIHVGPSFAMSKSDTVCGTFKIED